MIVRVKGGDGGDGGIGFFRSSRNPKGKPAGGNGGRGGNVIFQSDPSLDSLNHIERMIMAGKGGRGGRNMKDGSNGYDTIVKVPWGTELKISAIDEDETMESFSRATDISSDMNETDLEKSKSPFHVLKHPVMPYGDLPKQDFYCFESKDDNQSFPTARGGRGGRGNYAFGRNNHECEKGQPGEELYVELNLKTMADVGLVGLPNAGKSSFLAAVSNAHPRIAPYPFTTLNPYVGIIEYEDGRRLRVADIPGLIEGAHQNRGLGHSFLKHISKARLLAFVVDFSAENPCQDIQILLKELQLYEEKLVQKFRMVVANKADLLTFDQLTDRIHNTKEWLQAHGFGIHILPISAKFNIAIKRVTEELYHLAQSNDKVISKPEEV